MKIYTKTGDNGETGLVGGGRVLKDSLLMQALGDVDELNAEIGVCRAALEAQGGASGGGDLRGVEWSFWEEGRALFVKILDTVQRELFDMGADLATPKEVAFQKVRVTAQQVTQLEGWIDEVSAPLEPLQHFILPGGSGVGAHLHFARAVCRRAERSVVALGKSLRESDGSGEPEAGEKGAVLNPQIQIYLNRLSDLLFVLARAVNKAVGVAEMKWER